MQPLDIHPSTLYRVECWRGDTLVWVEDFPNLVTTVGKNEIINACFKAGKAANAWFVGLVGSSGFTGYAVSNTMVSHVGWAEGVPYSEATRPAYVAGAIAAGSVDNASSRAVFTINASETIYGAFLVDVATKAGTLGVLYGVGSFSASRIVIIGDILNVKITLTIT